MPIVPGRYIITEMDGVLTSNATTYKVDHAVKFVVFNDAVFVTQSRTPRMPQVGV